MAIIINDRSCEAKTGDRLLDVARANHSHIGYFCGGNALCQTCYVKVLEGAELLSPMTDAEQSMLSDTLIAEGTRMACQTYLEKPGTVKVLSFVEDVKHMTLTNPIQIPAYMGKMGWEAAVKFTDTIAFQARRENGPHRVDWWQVVIDVFGGISDAIQLVAEAVQSTFSPKKDPVLPEASACCCGTTKQEPCCPAPAAKSVVPPEVLRLHETSAAACN